MIGYIDTLEATDDGHQEWSALRLPSPSPTILALALARAVQTNTPQENPMLQHQLIDDESILIITPEGPLAREDFTALAAEIDPAIERSGRLQGLMIEAQTFPGWEDFSAMTTHLRFVRDHHRLIRRVAVVSDSPLLAFLPHLASHFVAAQVRHFPHADLEGALGWLRAA